MCLQSVKQWNSLFHQPIVLWLAHFKIAIGDVTDIFAKLIELNSKQIKEETKYDSTFLMGLEYDPKEMDLHKREGIDKFLF